MSIRQRGQKFAVRLVFFDSLIEYLKSCETDSTKDAKGGAEAVDEED